MSPDEVADAFSQLQLKAGPDTEPRRCQLGSLANASGTRSREVAGAQQRAAPPVRESFQNCSDRVAFCV